VTTSTHSVQRTRSAGRVVGQLSKPARLRYESAVAELRGRGCEAGGYRLRATSTGDYPLCCRYFYRQWRMHLAFPETKTVVIVSISEHTDQNDPHAILAEVFPGLSATGRRRSGKPRCCEQADQPPVIGEELRGELARLFGV
jgi:hypothetical protein